MKVYVVDSPSCQVIRWKKSEVHKCPIDAGTVFQGAQNVSSCFCVFRVLRCRAEVWTILVISPPTPLCLSGLCLTQRITRLLHSLATNKFPICAGAYVKRDRTQRNRSPRPPTADCKGSFGVLWHTLLRLNEVRLQENEYSFFSPS